MDLSLAITFLFFIVAVFVLGVIFGFSVHASYTVRNRKATNRKTILQVKPSAATRIIGWGYSFDSDNASVPVKTEPDTNIGDHE